MHMMYNENIQLFHNYVSVCYYACYNFGSICISYRIDKNDCIVHKMDAYADVDNCVSV